MAIKAIVKIRDLDEDFVFVPERYDPRRSQRFAGQTRIEDVADVVSIHISQRTADNNTLYIILDTGDAQEGVVRPKRQSCSCEAIRSAKKRIESGDVIISRLRPYLRQVAFVDHGLLHDDEVLLGSTEFYVLRSKSRLSVAFLVPFLLSDSVQHILAASQEGGHHPRFNEKTLRNIIIPDSLLRIRKSLSTKVAKVVDEARRADQDVQSLVSYCNDLAAMNIT